MRIVFYSPNFHPLIGGLENVVMDLATESAQAGHEVKVITLTPTSTPDDFPFVIIRSATFWQTVQHMRWAEVIVQFNVSLKGILPFLIARRPLVITHHNVYPTKTLLGRVKWYASRLASINTACSQFISNHISGAIPLPNPYQENVFNLNPSIERTKDLLFLGRLVSVKGCRVLIDALHHLREQYHLQPSLTIIGDGPEKLTLAEQIDAQKLTAQVTFIGTKSGIELANLLNAHQIMIVPSTYEEPFGIVALEGIACGCLVIGSAAGGLPEAIGPCGLTFPKGDAKALAYLLAEALETPSLRTNYQRFAPSHLASHQRSVVASRFTDILTKVVYG